MSTRPTTQITSDVGLSRTQDNTARAIQDLQTRAPFLNGVILAGVAISTGGTDVAHGLGRAPLGWFLVGIDANSVVYESSTSDSKFLHLKASAAATVKVWVF